MRREIDCFQHDATADSGSQVSAAGSSTNAANGPADGALDEGPDGIIEQWISIEDADGNPVEGYKYDLFRGSAPHAFAVHFNAGETIKVAGEQKLKVVFWLARDSAERG
jgi:hypothetical protein